MKNSQSSISSQSQLDKCKKSEPKGTANRIAISISESLVKGLMAGVAHLVTFHLLKRYFFSK